MGCKGQKAHRFVRRGIQEAIKSTQKKWFLQSQRGKRESVQGFTWSQVSQRYSITGFRLRPAPKKMSYIKVAVGIIGACIPLSCSKQGVFLGKFFCQPVEKDSESIC